MALLLLPLDIISKLKCDAHTCVYSCVSGVVVNVSPFQHDPTSVTEKVVWRFHSPIGQQCLKSRISRLKSAAETSSSFSTFTDCSLRLTPSRPGRKRRRIGTAKPARQTPKSWADPTPIAVRHRDERVEGSQFEDSFFYISPFHHRVSTRSTTIISRLKDQRRRGRRPARVKRRAPGKIQRDERASGRGKRQEIGAAVDETPSPPGGSFFCRGIKWQKCRSGWSKEDNGKI